MKIDSTISTGSLNQCKCHHHAWIVIPIRCQLGYIPCPNLGQSFKHQHASTPFPGDNLDCCVQTTEARNYQLVIDVIAIV